MDGGVKRGLGGVGGHGGCWVGGSRGSADLWRGILSGGKGTEQEGQGQ